MSGVWWIDCPLATSNKTTGNSYQYRRFTQTCPVSSTHIHKHVFVYRCLVCYKTDTITSITAAIVKLNWSLLYIEFSSFIINILSEIDSIILDWCFCWGTILFHLISSAIDSRLFSFLLFHAKLLEYFFSILNDLCYFYYYLFIILFAIYYSVFNFEMNGSPIIR